MPSPVFRLTQVLCGDFFRKFDQAGSCSGIVHVCDGLLREIDGRKGVKGGVKRGTWRGPLCPYATHCLPLGLCLARPDGLPADDIPVHFSNRSLTLHPSPRYINITTNRIPKPQILCIPHRCLETARSSSPWTGWWRGRTQA